MNRRIAIFALVAACMAAGPALASAPKKDAAAPAPTILMSPLALPVIIDGRLVNYIYVNIRLNLAAGTDSSKIRDKEPFFRDALVRAAHRTLLVAPDNPNKLDEPRFKALVMRETGAVAGRGVVTGFQILREKPQRNVSRSQMAPRSAPTGRPAA